MDCGPSFLCSAGACVVDPASSWNVVLEMLEVPTTDYTGAAWDAFGGAPDPFVEVRVGSDTATPSESGSATDTFTVAYDGSPTASDVRADALQTYLSFNVYDYDPTSANDWIGGGRYTGLEESVFTGGTQMLEFGPNPMNMSSGFTLYWHLERF
jgi:hypothetical protein